MLLELESIFGSEAKFVADKARKANEQTQRELTRKGGAVIRKEFAYYHSLPLRDVAEVSRKLRERGFELRQCRPYLTQSGEVLVAANWDRDPAESELWADMTLAQVSEKEPQMKERGYAPTDITCYLVPGANGVVQERLAVVWRKARPAESDYRLLGELTETAYRREETELAKKGFFPLTVQVFEDHRGERLVYAILSRNSDLTYASASWDQTAEEAMKPVEQGDPPVLFDLRPIVPCANVNPKLRWESQLARAEEDRRQDGMNDNALLRQAEALFHLGHFAQKSRHEEALKCLDAVSDSELQASVLYWRSLIHIRMGSCEQARQNIEQLARKKAQAATIQYLTALADATAGREIPMNLADGTPVQDRYNIACVYAWAANLENQAESNRKRYAIRAMELLEVSAESASANHVHYQTDSDLAVLMDRPDFKNLIERMTRRVPCVRLYLAAIKGMGYENSVLVRGGPVESKAQSDVNEGLVVSVAAYEQADSKLFAKMLWTRVGSPLRATNVIAEAGGAIARHVEQLRDEKIKFRESTGSARKWWEAFEKENLHRPRLVVRLMEELANRNGTVSEFFLAYVYSNTDNIQANLHYMDFVRVKKEYSESLRLGGLDRDPFDSYLAWSRKRPASRPSTQPAAPLVLARERVKFDQASSDAQAWWQCLERSTPTEAVLLHLADELTSRPESRLDDLLLAAAYSNTDDVLGHLHYLDFLKRRAEEEKQKKGDPATRPVSRESEFLRKYAVARLLCRVPPEPRVATKLRSDQELEAAIIEWLNALADYQGEISKDLVYSVSLACAGLVSDALTNKVAANPVELALRISKAAKYLLHEKDITVQLLANLPEAPAAPEQNPALSDAHKVIEDTYGVHDFVRRHKLSRRSDLARYAHDDQETLRLLAEDLSAADFLGDLRKMTELFDLLRPDEKRVRAALADNVPAEVVKRILAMPIHRATADQLGRYGYYDAISENIQVLSATPDELRLSLRPEIGETVVSTEAVNRTVKLLKPDCRFHLVRIGWQRLHLVYWDGARWTMLGPIWEALDSRQ